MTYLQRARNHSKNCTLTNIRLFSQKIKINERQSLRGQKEGFRMKISE